MYFYRYRSNRNVVSPVDSSRKSVEQFQDLYVKQRNYKTSEQITVYSHDGSNNFTVIQYQAYITPITRTIDPRISYGSYNANYTGPLRFFDDNELTLNVVLDFFLPLDPLSNGPTYVRYLFIKYYDQHLVVDMFNTNTYYTYDGTNYNPTTPDPSFFTIVSPGSIPSISASRIEYLNSVVVGSYTLLYIQFTTLQMGNIYLELVWSPDWSESVNLINILADDVSFAYKNPAYFAKKNAYVLTSPLN
jgi:hypothetical protein